MLSLFKKSEDIIALAETEVNGCFYYPSYKTKLEGKRRLSGHSILFSAQRGIGAPNSWSRKSIGKLELFPPHWRENIQKQKESISKASLDCDLWASKRPFSAEDLNFKTVRGIVLDEADRLLDMGFKDEICFLLTKPKTGNSWCFQQLKPWAFQYCLQI